VFSSFERKDKNNAELTYNKSPSYTDRLIVFLMELRQKLFHGLYIDYHTKFFGKNIEKISDFVIVESSISCPFDKNIQKLTKACYIEFSKLVFFPDRKSGYVFAIFFGDIVLKTQQLFKSLQQSRSQMLYFQRCP